MLDMSEEEKEVIFKNHRVMIPHFSSGDSFHSFMEKHGTAQEKGLKDWQIFYPKNRKIF